MWNNNMLSVSPEFVFANSTPNTGKANGRYPGLGAEGLRGRCFLSSFSVLTPVRGTLDFKSLFSKQPWGQGFVRPIIQFSFPLPYLRHSAPKGVGKFCLSSKSTFVVITWNLSIWITSFFTKSRLETRSQACEITQKCICCFQIRSGHFQMHCRLCNMNYDSVYIEWDG